MTYYYRLGQSYIGTCLCQKRARNITLCQWSKAIQLHSSSTGEHEYKKLLYSKLDLMPGVQMDQAGDSPPSPGHPLQACFKQGNNPSMTNSKAKTPCGEKSKL